MTPAFASYLGIILNATLDTYPTCPNIVDYQSVGKVAYPDIDEGSGLVWSKTDEDGMFWTINDSGGDAEAYAIDIKGEYLGKIYLKNVENIDFEAISTARCSKEFRSPFCLYLGDIGDNEQVYKDRIIYKVREPTKEELSESPNLTIETEEWSNVTYRYEKDPENSESFIIDPLTREVIIITKGFYGSKVFTGPLDGRVDGSIITLKDLKINLPLLLATDASYSEGYYSFGIRTYNHIFLYKNDKKLRPFTEMLAEDTPCKLSIIPTDQDMGESLSLDGMKKIYIHSEGVGKDIFVYDTIV